MHFLIGFSPNISDVDQRSDAKYVLRALSMTSRSFWAGCALTTGPEAFLLIEKYRFARESKSSLFTFMFYETWSP